MGRIDRPTGKPGIPWYIVPGLVLFGLSIWGTLILDTANQTYTGLSLEQDASLLASSVATLFGPGPGQVLEDLLPSGPAGEAGNRPGLFQGPRNGLDGSRHWYEDRLAAFGQRSRQLLAESGHRGLRGMALYAPRTGLIRQSSRYQAGLLRLLETPGAFRLLPYGDRICHLNQQGSMVYLRPLMNSPMRRPGPEDAALRGLHLVLIYDGGELVLEGLGRRIIIWSIAGLVWTALASMVLLLRRNQRLQEHLGQQEVLARAGAAARTLAHEMRTPLSIILMQKTLLQRSLGQEQAKALERIETQTLRLKALADDLRVYLAPGPARQLPEGTLHAAGHARRSGPGFAAAGGPGISETPEGCELPAFFQELLDTGIWPGTSLSGGPACQAAVDPADLQSMVGNLLQNARDASRDSPVEIAWTLQGGQVRIALADQAGGVPWRLRRRLFEPFFTTRSTGMGLGLKHARQLARQAGGDLVYRHCPASRRQGRRAGSCFTLVLPARPDSAGQANTKEGD